MDHSNVKKYFLLTAFLLSTNVFATTPSEIKTERYFASIQNNPTKLTEFLYRMPKGGDLHNHLSGASYAEYLLRYAKNDGLCVDRTTFTAFEGVCIPENSLTAAVQDPSFKDALIDAWSMRHFVAGSESGHDHFFNVFGKIGAVTGNHIPEMLTEVVERAGKQNESYVELMITLDGSAAQSLGKQLGWNSDFEAMRNNLLAAGLLDIVKQMSVTLDDYEAKKNQWLSCGTLKAKTGCDVQARILYQVAREQVPEAVFAQLVAGFEAATADPRIVGINMVQPEDGPISMRDYALHMQMVGYLHTVYPNVNISLHAGELTSAYASPEGLSFHIHDAVTVAHANRIGHGVDIKEETNANQLLKDMAANQIMVEINLTSNAGILNVEGDNHPLPLYMNYGVPVALSTDDEAVNRSNLTNEFKRAVETYHLSYLDLKNFARNSLTYAFLPGKSLWQSNNYAQFVAECGADYAGEPKLSVSCKAFLAANEKAKMQWDLEQRFERFEK